MPRVSVVVPIYNVERYLVECLESLAQQTLSDLEVVMVDDGSTDSSARHRRRLRRERRPLRPGPPAQRRPRQRPQHRGGPRHRRLPGVRRQRRHRHPHRLRDARRLPRPHRLRLRHRQLPPPHDGRHPAGRHGVHGVQRLPAGHPRHQAPGAAQRPHRLEQAVPPDVLGRARLPLARGRALRGHPGDAAGARPRPRRRRDPRAGLPVARTGGRQHVHHPATDRDRAPSGTASPPSTA